MKRGVLCRCRDIPIHRQVGQMGLDVVPADVVEIRQTSQPPRRHERPQLSDVSPFGSQSFTILSQCSAKRLNGINLSGVDFTDRFFNVVVTTSASILQTRQSRASSAAAVPRTDHTAGGPLSGRPADPR